MTLRWLPGAFAILAFTLGALAPGFADAQAPALTLSAVGAPAKSGEAPFSTSFTLKVASTKPLPEDVELAFLRAPSGWTTTLNPSSFRVEANGERTATLSVSVPSAAVPGVYPVEVVGRSPTTRLASTNAFTFNVTVLDPPPPPENPTPPSFTLGVRDHAVHGLAGDRVSNLVTVASQHAPNGVFVKLDAFAPSAWPAGAVDFEKQVPVYEGSPVELAIDVRIPATVAPGEYVVTVRASSPDVPSLVREETFRVVVDAPAAPTPEPGEPTPPAPDPAEPGAEGPPASGEPVATAEPTPSEPAPSAAVLILKLSSPSLRVAPGETVTSAVEITNVGDATRTVALSSTLPAPFVVKFQAGGVVTVQAGGATTVLYSVQAPADAAPGDSASGLVRAGDASEPVQVAITAPSVESPQEAVVQERSPASAPASPLARLVEAYGVAPLAAAAGVAVAGGAGLWLVGAPNARRHLWWIGLGMYTRLTRPKLLDHPERERLFHAVEAQPGIHFHALQRELGWNTGALTYHLRVLERHQLLVSRRDGILRRFYLVGQAPRAMPVATAPVTGATVSLSGLRGNVLSTVRERGSIAQSALAEELGASKQTLNYHVKNLERLGLLRVERVGRDTVLYPAGGDGLDGFGANGTGAGSPPVVVNDAGGFSRADDYR